MSRIRIVLLAALAVVLAVAIIAFRVLFPGEPERSPPAPVAAEPFEEVPVPFVHRYTNQEGYSFLGASAIDVDGDGSMEAFVGGAEGQADALLAWRDGSLVDVIEGTGLSDDEAATYGSAAVDLDADGDTDLVVGRSSGLTLYLNTGGIFEARPIDAGLAPGSDVFAVSVSDFDRDGDGDLYLSVFIEGPSFVGRTFNDPSVVRGDRLLRNEGDLRFVDVTAEIGLGPELNVFQSVWVDLDQDGYEDLVVAPNTGQVAVFRNQGGKSLERQPPLSAYGFWMCAAAGDIDNDGDVDLFFSNAGNVGPRFLLTGDLRDDQTLSEDWLLLRNDGGMRFTDVTAEYGLDGYGFAWGASFEDLDADGWLDLVVSQNAEKLPTHRFEALRPSSKAFLQRPKADGRRGFFDVAALGLQRPDFGQAPLFLDLDGDHRQDVLMLNQNQPARAYLGRTRSARLMVQVPDTVAALGTRVVVETEAGATLTRTLYSSVGFMTEHSPVLNFGLGDGAARRVLVHWPGAAAPQVIERPQGPLLKLEWPGASPEPSAGEATAPSPAADGAAAPEVPAAAEPAPASPQR